MVPTGEPLREEPVAPILIIGRKEYVAFPEWDIGRVRAKIDTGAYSSALGVYGCQVVETPAGPVARIEVHAGSKQSKGLRMIEAPVVQMVRVRSTSGKQEVRPLIEAVVRLGPVTRRIRLTLTDRSRMRCRLLLGRQALAGQFLVDVRSKDLLKRPGPGG
jgi:hypothetical protein